jgi:DNA replication protein DnaC
MALAAALVEQRRQFAIFRALGRGKSHHAAAPGVTLVESGWRVLFARATDIVQP